MNFFSLHQINLTIGNQVDKEEMRNGYSPSGNCHIGYQYNPSQNELSKLDISCPGIFKLEDFWAERSERNDACCEEPFADITYVKNTNLL